MYLACCLSLPFEIVNTNQCMCDYYFCSTIIIPISRVCCALQSLEFCPQMQPVIQSAACLHPLLVCAESSNFNGSLTVDANYGNNRTSVMQQYSNIRSKWGGGISKPFLQLKQEENTEGISRQLCHFKHSKQLSSSDVTII